MSKFHPHIKKALPNAGACSTEPNLKALMYIPKILAHILWITVIKLNTPKGYKGIFQDGRLLLSVHSHQYSPVQQEQMQTQGQRKWNSNSCVYARLILVNQAQELQQYINKHVKCHLRVLLGLTPSPFCVSVESVVSLFSIKAF